MKFEFHSKSIDNLTVRSVSYTKYARNDGLKSAVNTKQRGKIYITINLKWQSLLFGF